jgi:hypothetical protein
MHELTQYNQADYEALHSIGLIANGATGGDEVSHQQEVKAKRERTDAKSFDKGVCQEETHGSHYVCQMAGCAACVVGVERRSAKKRDHPKSPSGCTPHPRHHFSRHSAARCGFLNILGST